MMKRTIKRSLQLSVAIITFIIVCCFQTHGSYAATLDCTAPEVNEFYFVQSVVHPGENIDIILDVTEEESGISSIEIGFTAVGCSPREDANFWGALRWPASSGNYIYKIDSNGKETLFKDDVMYTGRYRISIPVRKSYEEACYSCERWPYILLFDNGGTYNSKVYRNRTVVEPYDGKWVQYTGNEPLIISRFALNPESGEVEGSTEYTDRGVPTFAVKGYEFNEWISSDSLIQDIKNLKPGETGFIKIDDEGTLPKEAFDALKGKDAEIVCSSNQYKWTFNGKDIGNNTKDVNLLIDTSSVDDNSDSLSKVDVLKLEFADNGELPGKARVAIDKSIIDTDATSGDLALYYVDGDTYIPVDASIRYEKDAGETWCSFDVSHNSTYVLATKAKIIGCKDSYTYTGKSIKPSIKIILNGKTLKAGTHYTVSYAKNKLVGTATVSVHGKGDIKGETSTKFKIVPKKTSISKVSSAKRAFTVKWKKQPAQTSGYEVRYSSNPSMSGSKTKTISKNSILSKKISSLKAKRKYYVQVRTYKKVSGSKYYSSWSSAKSVKTK